jgi:7,8-dihydropterin-6-yl-methyl-4-(beta-D-ribofuranosyl)aminobenzene 5'-phosphate synthase
MGCLEHRIIEGADHPQKAGQSQSAAWAWREVAMRTKTRSAAVDRRAVLCGGGAVAFETLLASLLGGTTPVRAEGLSGSVPEVDRVAVRVLIDSYQIAVAPSGKAGNVEIRRFGWAIGKDPPGRALISEFGLSLHVESRSGETTRHTLVDFGYTPQALTNNAEILGIDPGALDALVLSHGHYDHFGGLAGFLEVSKNRLKPGIPLFVGGEECFCARQWTAPPQPGDFGVLDRPAIERNTVKITVAQGPTLVADHAFTTGQVPQTTFEKLLSPSRMTIGMKQGLGCYPESFPEDERKAGNIPDQFRHEIATIYNLKGRGLVVLTSCSHRGVVNVVKQAQSVSGVQRVHAVLGGFHLAPYKEEYLQTVIANLKEIDPDYIVPMHCTGEPFWEMARREIPQKLLRGYTGTQFVFSA